MINQVFGLNIMLCHAACMLDMNPPINVWYMEVTCECTADQTKKVWLLTDTLEQIEINQVNRIQQGICLNKNSFMSALFLFFLYES